MHAPGPLNITTMLLSSLFLDAPAEAANAAAAVSPSRAAISPFEEGLQHREAGPDRGGGGGGPGLLRRSTGAAPLLGRLSGGGGGGGWDADEDFFSPTAVPSPQRFPGEYPAPIAPQ